MSHLDATLDASDSPALDTSRSTQSGYGSLARNHDFTLLWVGQTISDMGARASAFVFPILAFALTSSAMAAAAVDMLFLLGVAATLLPAGVLADRVHRRMLMRTSAALGAMLYASLALAGLAHHLTVEHLFVVALMTGLTTGVFGPAETSAIRTVVPPEQMPTALAQQQAREHIATLTGAPIGGALYSLSRWMPFALNTVSYAAAWILLGRMRADLSPAATDPAAGRPHARRDLIEGLRFTWRQPFLRLMLIWSPLVNLVGNALFLLAVLQLIRAGTPAGAIAVGEVAVGLAGILGALLAPRLIARVPTGWLTIAVAWSVVPLAVPIALWPTVPVVATALSLIMVLNPAGNAALGAYRIAMTPEALTGRVQAAMQCASWSTMPLAPLLAGVLLSTMGGVPGGLALAGLVGMVALIPTCSTVVRRVPRPDLWRVAAPRT